MLLQHLFFFFFRGFVVLTVARSVGAKLEPNEPTLKKQKSAVTFSEDGARPKR